MFSFLFQNPRIGFLLLPALALAACQTEPARKAEKTAWLQEQSIPIFSINPGDTIFSDLQFLKEELKGVEIIGLGEQSHGDGSTFLAKARLVKFLHQEMGFSLLAFESGILDCTLALQAFEGGATIDSAFRAGVFKIWSNSSEVAELRQYAGSAIADASTPPFVGFDCQLSGNLPPQVRADAICRFLQQEHPGFDSSAFSLVWQVLAPDSPKNFAHWKRDTIFQQAFFAQLDSLSRLAARLQPATLEGRLMQRGVSGLKHYYFFIWKMNAINPDYSALNVRDSVMAANLAWLKEEIFPGRKVIIWAANTHLGYERQKLKYPDAMHPMGSYLKQWYGDKYYVLSFTAYTGRYGSLQSGLRNVPACSNKSLEYLWADTGYPNACLRRGALATFPFEHPFQARLYGYANWYAEWPEMTDGIFFIRDMLPSHVVD